MVLLREEDERFYRTFADIPVDSAIRFSIKELRADLENPVKNADKLKTIKEKYDAIMKKLEEEKKKQLAKQKPELMVVGKSFTRPYQGGLISSVLDVSPVAAVSGGESPPIAPFIKLPFSSPNTQRNPDYSTQNDTPSKPLSKSVTRPPLEQPLEITGTPLRNPFNVNGPITSPLFSPPPPHQSANQENENPQLLLSPGPAVRKLPFDEEYTDTY